MTPPATTRSQLMIRDSEANKDQPKATSGREDSSIPMSYLHSVYVDEEYLVMGSHLDQAIIQKIHNHEFVDFSKLLPQDRVHVEDDSSQRKELINKNGMTYWSPVSSRESSNLISSFNKWENAFRVFSNVYTTKYPLRATELLQYAHVIYTASMAYHWDNVYLYDKEFRLHMCKHPQRNWSIILQQAWNLRLKDKLRFESHSGDKAKTKSNDICKRFNRKCNLGSGCRFVHKCFGCGKFGHGVHICRHKSNQGDDQHKSPS